MPLFVDNGSSPTDGITSNEHAVLNHTGVPGVAGSSLGGDGSLGDIVIAAGATTINGVRNYNNLTIDPGATVTHDVERAMHLKCRGFFLNNGTIDLDGKGLPGNTVIDPTSDHEGDAPYQFGCSARGGDGGQGGGVPPFAGCRRAGAFGGGSLYVSDTRPGWVTDLEIIAPIAAPGGGGAAGTEGVNATNGVGGDGGGCLIIEALGAVTEGTITAVGDNGTDGSTSGGAGGGGGGGAGGMILVLHGGTLTTGTITNTGGLGGNGAGGGTNGAAGEAGILRRIQIP